MNMLRSTTQYGFAWFFFLWYLHGCSQSPADTTLRPPPLVQQEAAVDGPYTYVEKMPAFPGGTEEMYKFIYACLAPDTTTAGFSGTVVTQFVVAADGTLEKFKTLRSPDRVLTTAVEKCLAAMPKWSPGLHEGKAVPVTFTIPVRFLIN